MHRLLIICVFYFTILSSLVESIRGSRKKRVINGSPYLDIEKSDYLSFRYFVWIGNGHNCDVTLPDKVKEQAKLDKNYEVNLGLGWVAYWWGVICSPRHNNLQCTGSLLTPLLVQTACHCIVHFYSHQSSTGRAVAKSTSENKPDPWNGNYVCHPKPGRSSNSLRVKQEGIDGQIDWKHSKYHGVCECAHYYWYSVHSAARFVDYLPDGVYSKNFFVHPKCVDKPIEKSADLRHDYGLIVLEHALTPVQGVFAPLYRVKDLANIWTGIMSNRKVCLNIGFGDVDPAPEVVKSEALTHGWVSTLDYITCAERVRFAIPDKAEFDRETTWFCEETLGFVSQATGKGDSGGPVTCDNEYAGLVCQGNNQFSRVMSTAFSVYENAYEYRDELSYRLYELYGPKDKMNNYRPTSEPFHVMHFQGNLTSTGPTLSNSIIIIIFMTAVLVLLYSHIKTI